MVRYWKAREDLTDRQLITMLLDARDLLNEREESAFDSMNNRVKQGIPLTAPQRQWAEDTYERYELEANRTLNLVSSGQVLKTNVPTFDWEKNKPLKPPGR